MNIKEMLQGARDRLNTPGDDPDKLTRVLTFIHSALEEYARQALSAPSVRAQHGLDAKSKNEVSWRQIPELMQQFYGWTQQDIRYAVKMNGIRNEVNHGGKLRSTRAELQQYLEFAENKINKSQFTNTPAGDPSSSYSQTTVPKGEYFPAHKKGRREIKPFRFRIKRGQRGVVLINRWGADVIGSNSAIVYWFIRIGAGVVAFFLSQIATLIVTVIPFYLLFNFGKLIGLNPESLDSFFGLLFFLIWMFALWLGYRYITKFFLQSKNVTIAPNQIHIGRRSYPLPDGTYFRYIPQSIPDRYKIYAVQPGGGAYFAFNLTHSEAEELLRISTHAHPMSREE